MLLYPCLKSCTVTLMHCIMKQVPACALGSLPEEKNTFVDINCQDVVRETTY